MRASHTASILAILMCCASVAGIAARPSAKAPSVARGVSLESTVPKSFGEWTELRERSSEVVNPQIKEQLDRLYSQLVTRTYVNKEGYRIMLSIAYGADQRGGLQAHRPEVCYPGQGFNIAKIEDGSLGTSFGDIEVRRLLTSQGARNEPVTYWLTVGDQRIAEMRLALTGQIPDGLLFRISSIDADPARAFVAHQKFAADMMASVPVDVRKQLSGLTAPKTAG
jgi:EpsI family protein